MAIVGQDNFNDLLPAAPSGRKNIKWQADAPGTNPRDVSAYVSNIGSVDARTTTSETIALAALGKLVTFNNSGAVAVTLDSTVPSDFFCAVEDLGVGTATLTPSSGTINGVATLALATGQGGLLFFDGTNWKAVTGGGGGAGHIYPVSAVVGKPAAGQLVCIYTAAVSATFPVNFASPNSYGSVGVNPTATATYTVYKNGSSVGTIAISTGAAFTFTTAGFSLAAGDRLTIVAPGSQDATLADVGITLAGTL
jgi:hypothetical protein